MSELKVLIVDDEEAMRESLAAWLEKDGHQVGVAESGDRGLGILARERYDLILLDIKMPGMDGHEFLRRVRENDREIMVVMITAYGSIDSAVAAMKEGADDYLLKPFDPEHLMLLIEKMRRRKESLNQYAVMRARLAEFEQGGFEDLVGRSQAMREVFSTIEDVAGSEAPVLILGETGTGKELVARALHNRSPRRHGPFVALNCGALPENLLESELFGHERGAFTGAVKTRLGRLEMSDRGSLFLDEIGEVSAHMQVNLLRAIEEKRFTRLGGSLETESDFRLICATHRNMERLVEDGAMRSDFFYRVNVITIRVPPLRQRREDIPLLADHFLVRYSGEMNKPMRGITDSAYAALEGYPWPGNVRELRNVIERAVVLSRDGRVSAGELSFLLAAPSPPDREGTLEKVEARHIQSTLDDCGWNISRAAGILGINRGTLARKVKKYGLARPDKK